MHNHNFPLLNPKSYAQTDWKRNIANLSSDSKTSIATTLSRVQSNILTTSNSLWLLYDLLSLGENQLDVAWVGHIWVDLYSLAWDQLHLQMVKLTRPWARYVRRRCLGAWLTWMCLTMRFPVSRPLVSALASAFLRRPSKNSADFTGHLARETPNCFPTNILCQ